MPHRAIPVFAVVAMLVSACQMWTGDVPYLPTPPRVVDKMLTMARVGPGDIVYDLGSGDGRIVIAAVRDYGAARAVGIELDADLVFRSRKNAELAGVEDRTRFLQQDIFKTDFSEATVLTMFLLNEVNLRLRPRILSSLRPGTRVVSHRFEMDDWEPDERALVDGRSVYFWIVPAQVEGTWRWTLDGQVFRLELDQQYQEVDGELQIARDGETVQARSEEVRLVGDRLRFTARVPQGERTVTLRFDGRLDGGWLTGELSVDGEVRRVEARRER